MMDLVPWKSFKDDMERLRREMDNLWNRLAGETSLAKSLQREWAPTTDTTETSDAIHIKAELPGLEPSDIEVSILDDVLTIKGEKKQEEEKEEEHHHYRECFYGSFQRSFRLPAEVQTDKIEAKFDKGVLRITLPKSEETKKKEIKIHVK